MGLKGTINRAINTAFKVLGSSSSDGLNVSVSYKIVLTAPAFNPTTGAMSGGTFSTSVFDAIFYDVDIREVDEVKVKVDDKRIIFPSSLVSPTYKPSQTDKVTIDTVVYDVKSWSQDPAKATWILLLRSG